MLCSSVYVRPFSSWDMRGVSAPLGAPGPVKWPHILQTLHNHLGWSSDLMSPTRWLTAVQQIWPYVYWLTTETVGHITASFDFLQRWTCERQPNRAWQMSFVLQTRPVGVWALLCKCCLLVLRTFFLIWACQRQVVKPLILLKFY